MNLLSFCMIFCMWCYLKRKINNLRRKINVVSALNSRVNNSHVMLNSHFEHGVLGSQSSKNNPATINTSVSEPIALSSHSKPVQDSSDYSTVVDAVPSSQGRVQSVSNKKYLKQSKSATAAIQSAHPFSTDSTTNPTKKPTKKKPLRPAPPIPIAKLSDGDSKQIGELEHSYAHIVDGLSPPEDGELVDPTSPPHIAAKLNAATNIVTSDKPTNTTTTTTNITTRPTVEEIEGGYVYSTPIANGMKNFRRMTASNIKKDSTSEGAAAAKEKYIRPKSALGVYPPLDSDLYTSSCNSSPLSIRKNIRKTRRPVSENLL